jgi:hypothetical protein
MQVSRVAADVHESWEMAGDPVERQFHKDMAAIYERARDEAGYVATRFIQLVSEKGGLAAARQLLHGGPSDGFTALWEKGRLDLSVEALVLKPAYAELFSDEDRAVARRRLRDYGFTVR